MHLDDSNTTGSLVEKIAEGDEQAFARFYSIYYPQLLPFLRKHIEERGEADEILQQVFLRVWLNRDKLPGVNNMKAWLSRITAREYLRALRNKILHRERFPIENIEHYQEAPGAPSSHQLSLKELNMAIHEAVEKLSPQRKQIFRLSRMHGLSIQDIAGQLSLSTQTVKNTLSTALTEIRRFLQERGYTLALVQWWLLYYFFFKKF